jgi:hypothetical protein
MKAEGRGMKAEGGRRKDEGGRRKSKTAHCPRSTTPAPLAGELQSRGLVHCSARSMSAYRLVLPENMDLPPLATPDDSPCQFHFAVLLDIAAPGLTRAARHVQCDFEVFCDSAIGCGVSLEKDESPISPAAAETARTGA